MRYIINEDSPVSVASQCKLVLRAVEMEISAALWAHVALEGIYFIHYLHVLGLEKKVLSLAFTPVSPSISDREAGVNQK